MKIHLPHDFEPFQIVAHTGRLDIESGKIISTIEDIKKLINANKLPKHNIDLCLNNTPIIEKELSSRCPNDKKVCSALSLLGSVASIAGLIVSI